MNAALPVFALEPAVSLAAVLPGSMPAVTPDSPATAVVTDLTVEKAATTHPHTTLRQAEQMMIHQGVRMLFVVSDMPSLDGLVTAGDLHGDVQVRVAGERRARFDELTVADVMTGLDRLEAVDWDRLQSATVAQVVATLRRHGRHHLLVVQSATAHTPRRVRGVISRTRIERQLGQPIDVTPVASTFLEIERALV